MPILVGYPEENIPLGRVKRRWEDNIKVDLKELEWARVNWIRMGTSGGLL
jgi:hypothetical protein